MRRFFLLTVLVVQGLVIMGLEYRVNRLQSEMGQVIEILKRHDGNFKKLAAMFCEQQEINSIFHEMQSGQRADYVPLPISSDCKASNQETDEPR